MKSSNYSITFFLESSQPYYSNLDTIKGVVRLSIVKENLSVQTIQVSLRALSKVMIQEDAETLDGAFETHDLLFQYKTVFPPENIRNVSTNKNGFTLAPGTYDYDFEFKFPMNCYCGNPNVVPLGRYKAKNHKLSPLPPTLKGRTPINSYYINYYIQAVVGRPEMFKHHLKEELEIKFINSEPNKNELDKILSRLNQNKLKNSALQEVDLNQLDRRSSFFKKIFNNERSKLSNKVGDIFPIFDVDLKLDSTLIKHNKLPDITLSFICKKDPSTFREKSESEFFINSINLFLMRHTEFQAKDYKDHQKFMHPLLNLERKFTLDLSKGKHTTNGFELSFPKEYLSKDTLMILPDDITPSFETCNIKNWYSIDFVLEISKNINSRKWKRITLSREVVVLSGIKLPEQQAPEYINYFEEKNIFNALPVYVP